MPVILNIETSTDVCSVALTCDGQVVFNKENHESMSHASSLGGYVQDALSVAKSHHFAIDAVAVSRGPGFLYRFAYWCFRGEGALFRSRCPSHCR